MKTKRLLNVFIVLSVMGIVAAGDIFVGRDFFVLQAFAKSKTCRDFGLPNSCKDCGPNKICEAVKQFDGKDAIACYRCRDKRRCEDSGKLSKSGCASCTGDPTTMCAPTGQKDDFAQTCFECRKKKGKEVDCAYYGLPAQCPACPENQMCESIKKMDSGFSVSCYQCRDKHRCEDNGQLSKSACASCVEDPTMMCALTGSQDDFTQPCFECRKKKGKEIDCAYYGLSTQCPKCKRNQICEAVKNTEDGTTCYQCRDKRRCEDDGLVAQADCASCVDDPTMMCAPMDKKDDSGRSCFECRKKKGKEVDCAYYGLPAQCPACPENQMCEPLKKIHDGNEIACYQCRDKRRCEDDGLVVQADCASCVDDPTMMCAPAGQKDDFDQTCFECRKKKDNEIDCAYYILADRCDACPLARRKCVPVTKQAGDKEITCYECQRMRSCKDMELLGQPECASCSDDPSMICVPKGSDDFKHPCFECRKRQKCYDLGLTDLKGCQQSCAEKNPFMRCAPTVQTNTGEQCFECVKKTGEFIDCEMFNLKSKCSACGEGVRCEAVTKESEGHQITCYECKATRRCRDLGLMVKEACATCLDNPANMCVSKGVDDVGIECFECQKKEGSAIDCVYYGLQDKCESCGKDALCVPVDRQAGKEKITCYECKPKKNCTQLGLLASDDCAECIKDSSMICAPKGYDNFENSCFECRKRTPAEQCTYYLAFADCSQCKENERCVDAGLEGITCYKCEPKPKTIKVTYIVVIIEKTCVRVVLQDKGIDPSGLGDFEPSAVMALAEINPSSGQAEQNTSGQITRGFLEDIVGVLTKQLSSEKTSYDRYAFDGFKEYPFTETPPAVETSGVINSFGSEGKDIITSGGPVVVCGKKDGKDMVVVFDSKGRVVKAITKDEFIQHPGLIAEALIDAEDADKKYADENGSNMPQNSASPGTGAPVVQVANGPRVPNDPLYLKEGGKKEEAKAQPVVIGSMMKMGGSALGAGAGQGRTGPQIHDQWGVREIGFTPLSDPQSAWNQVDTGTKNVLVALIDSGLDMTHPDGPAYIWANPKEIAGNGADDDQNGYVDDIHGWNFLGNNNDLTDYRGHGTFVAGIIAAKMNNGIGIAGINPGAEIMPLKVTDENGSTNSLHIFRAIHYAVDNGARIINISLGGKEISKLEQSAIDEAAARGVLVVVASGNTGEYIGGFGPAGALGVVAVGSLDFEGTASTISGRGPNIALLAPGEKIYSLYSKDSKWPGGAGERERLYYAASGTSFSAPMVSATASLLLTQHPQLNNIQLEGILLNTAKDMGKEGWDDKTGAGKLNASAALQRQGDRLATVAINKIRINEEKGKAVSVDVFATAGGKTDSLIVELGEGKQPKAWKKIAGPAAKAAHDDWIVRIESGALQGSRDWVIRLSMQDQEGNVKTAQAALALK